MKTIESMLAQNIGNRITHELAAGMLSTIAVHIRNREAELLKAWEQKKEEAKEPGNGAGGPASDTEAAGLPRARRGGKV